MPATIIPEHNKICFSTGKDIHANNGIIGITKDLSVWEGYDGVIYDEDDYETELSRQEKVELADLMISLWKEFKKQAL